MIRSLWLSPPSTDRCSLVLLLAPPPLAIDHPLAGFGSFYGGVHHAYIVARPAYGPVEGVAVVDVEQVVAGATVGHVVVVGVVLGAEVVVAALGVHVVCHPVADLLEDHLVGSGGVAGVAIALDHSPDDLLGQGRAAAHQRHEHHRRHGYHHRYLLGAHLLLLPFLRREPFWRLCVPPSGFHRLSRTSLVAASGARRILRIRTLFELYSPECVEGAFSEVHLQHYAVA